MLTLSRLILTAPVSELSRPCVQLCALSAEFAAQYASRFVGRGLCGDIVVKENLMDQRRRQGAHRLLQRHVASPSNSQRLQSRLRRGSYEWITAYRARRLPPLHFDPLCTSTGFMSESLAMIDLLVLVHAQRFTGFVFSSFSWTIQVHSRPVPCGSLPHAVDFARVIGRAGNKPVLHAMHSAELQQGSLDRPPGILILIPDRPFLPHL